MATSLSNAEESPKRGAIPRSNRVILVGNPNVGKSLLFKRVTGRHVMISNYPGTTVDIARARATLDGHQAEVFDTPGLNDLTQDTEEARVTSRMIERYPDAVLVQVADAKNLRRALLLTLQLAELDRPLLLVLNMADELERSGARIDVDGLSRILGIPVVTTVALRGAGTDELIRTLPRARTPTLSRPVHEPYRDECEQNLARFRRVQKIVSEVWSLERPARPNLAVRVGFWAMHPLQGLPVVALVLLLTFWFVGLFGAGTLVDTLEVSVFQQRLHPAAIAAVDATLPFPHTHERDDVIYTLSLPLTPTHEVELLDSTRRVTTTDYTLDAEAPLSGGDRVLRFLHDLLVGDYGLITMALSYALAIVLPIVTTFFLLFSVLEDSGYLPRLSIMVNRLFRTMGLSGKAVLPMILGLGCDTMAVMTTRILDSRRERIVTTMLLALAVPCSAQLGVLLAMMARLSAAAAALWVALIVVVMIAVGWLTSRILGPGKQEFILELPPMRPPSLSNVLAKTTARVEWYLKEVIPLFALGTAVLFLLDRIGLLAILSRAGQPLVEGWLGLPAKTMEAFVIGFMRRDFGAVYLLDAATGADAVLSPHQILVAMVTITLFMPCIATFFMIGREHGQRVAWSMTAFIFPFAFLVGGLVHRLAMLLGV